MGVQAQRVAVTKTSTLSKTVADDLSPRGPSLLFHATDGSTAISLLVAPSTKTSPSRIRHIARVLTPTSGSNIQQHNGVPAADWDRAWISGPRQQPDPSKDELACT